MSINKVILVGYVGKDPVVRYFDKGVAKATFPLATSETYTNQQGETITTTEWHNIVLWRALAEVVEKTVKKGTQLYIVGKIKTRSYVDKDGNNKYITEILADTLLVLEKKSHRREPGRDRQETKNGISDKQPAASEFSEPGVPYPQQESHSEKYPENRVNNDINESGPGGAPFSDQGTGQNEDDLPF